MCLRDDGETVMPQCLLYAPHEAHSRESVPSATAHGVGRVCAR